MKYLSKAEFITEIISIKGYKDKIRVLKDELKRVKYQLYEKIKSPNDYDIIGYDSKKEAIRSPKIGSNASREQILENREKLLKKKDELQLTIKKLRLRVTTAENELASLPEPLQTMCRLKFVEQKTYNEIGRLYNMSQSTCFRYVQRELNKKYK